MWTAAHRLMKLVVYSFCLSQFPLKEWTTKRDLVLYFIYSGSFYRNRSVQQIMALRYYKSRGILVSGFYHVSEKYVTVIARFVIARIVLIDDVPAVVFQT